MSASSLSDRMGASLRLGKPTLKDASAGLINGVVSVPDGLASAALAGVNPIYGLYTAIVAPILGSLLVSTQRMQIATTSASALVAGETVLRYPADTRAAAMFLLTFVAGAFIIAGAMLRVGRLVKYVSQSVITGLLLGIAVLLVLDQLGPLLGYAPDGANTPAQAFDLLLNLPAIDPATATIGLAALAIAFVVGRTRWSNWASLAALALPTAALLILDWAQVSIVGDTAPITGGLPPFSPPAFGLLDKNLLLSAASLAVVILIQGAGVSQSVTNLDRAPVDANRDILAEGVANAAAGVLSGIPAGGSVGQTALNIEVGARTRWSGVFGGLWVLLFLVALPGAVSRVPMPVLAALMVVAGVGAIDFREARALWSVGWLPRIVAGATFATCLFASIAAAVAVGVLLSVVLALSNAAGDLRLVRIVRQGDELAEADVPSKLDGENPLIVLDVHGSLFFAGARSLEELLPAIGEVERPVVVLRLRGYTRAGVTLVDVLDRYADELAAAGGRLYLSGLGTSLLQQLSKALEFQDSKPMLAGARPILGASTREVVEAARRWRAGSS